MTPKWLILTFLIMATGMPAFAQGAPAAADAEAKTFQETVKNLDLNGNFLFFANAADAITVLDKAFSGVKANVVPLLMEGNPNQKQFIKAGQNLIDSLYKTSGFREIGGIGVSSRHIGDGVYRTKAFIQFDPTKKGKVWKLLGGQPKPLDYLDLLPTTTVAASFSDFDLTEMWKWHLELVQATGDAQLTGMHSLVMMGVQQKVDLPKLFASTSGTFGLIVTLDPTNEVTVPAGRGKTVKLPEPGIAFVAKVKDNTFKEFLLSKLTSKKDGKVVPYPFKEKTVKGITIRTFEMPIPIPIPLSPSIASIGDYLVISSTSKVIEGMIAAKTTGNGLKSQPAFKKLMTGMPTEGNALAYANPQLAKTVLSIQKQVATLGNGDQKRALEAVMKVYPQKEDPFGLSITRIEANGMSVIGKSNLSAPKAFAERVVNLAAWGAGMALPRVTKGAGKAKLVKCQGNLKQIGLGLLMYAGDNKGAFPNDLGTLYEKNYLKNLEAYVCPATAVAIPASAAEIRAGKCGYVYVGKGVRDDDPNGSKVVTAYDKPTNHGTTITFLFVDGHVEMVKTGDPLTTIKQRGWIVKGNK